MKDFKFSLYEVFGYFLPGAVLGVALVLLFWCFFFSDKPIPILTWHFDSRDWVAVVIACYFLGHIAQALGNLLFASTEHRILSRDDDESWTDIFKAAEQKAIEQLGSEQQQISRTWLYRYMDEYVVQNGNLGDRELFTYREGFYRGTSVSLLVLSVSMLVRLIIPNSAIPFPPYVYYPSRWQIAFLLIVLVASTFLMYRRFRRFSEHRVNRGVVAFLATRERDTGDSQEDS